MCRDKSCRVIAEEGGTGLAKRPPFDALHLPGMRRITASKRNPRPSNSRPMLRRPRPISKLRSMILTRPARHHGLP